MSAQWQFLGVVTAIFLLTIGSWTGGALAEREGPPPYTPDKGVCNDTEHEYQYQGLCCRQCPPGQFAKVKCSTTKNTLCTPCGEGSYTEIWHAHYACLPCRTRCYPDKHLVETSTCQAHSRRVCSCAGGYTCSQEEDGQCEQCVPSLGRTEAAPARRPLLLWILITVPTLLFLSALLLLRRWRRMPTLLCLKTESFYFETTTTQPKQIQPEQQNQGPRNPRDNSTQPNIQDMTDNQGEQTTQKTHRVFRSCTLSTKANVECPVELQPPEGPLSPPCKGGIAMFTLEQPEQHDCDNCRATEANHSEACPPLGNPLESANGRIGPLHIHSPGTVYVGYINNVSRVAPCELPLAPACCIPHSHREPGATEERLNYPRQEESCPGIKDLSALQELSSLEYWDTPTPQQEINGCGHWAASIFQHDLSEQGSWSAPTPLQEQSGPESLWFHGAHQKRCGCRFGEDHEPLHGQDEHNSVSVQVPQQVMSESEHFVVLSQQRRERALLRVPGHHQEQSRSGRSDSLTPDDCNGPDIMNCVKTPESSYDHSRLVHGCC